MPLNEKAANLLSEQDSYGHRVFAHLHGYGRNQVQFNKAALGLHADDVVTPELFADSELGKLLKLRLPSTTLVENNTRGYFTIELSLDDKVTFLQADHAYKDQQDQNAPVMKPSGLSAVVASIGALPARVKARFTTPTHTDPLMGKISSMKSHGDELHITIATHKRVFDSSSGQTTLEAILERFPDLNVKEEASDQGRSNQIKLTGFGITALEDAFNESRSKQATR